jgi:translation initiation factor IF-1
MNQTKEQHIEVEGVVLVVLPGTMFRVELANKHMVLATVCGKMRKRWVRITAGDRVKMEMSPYDLDKGRITWRLRRDGWLNRILTVLCASGIVVA